MTYARKPNKDGRIGRETDIDPALVVMNEGHTIVAQHQFSNEKGVLCVYLGNRSNGIDLKLNEWVAVVRTEDAARALRVEDEFATAFTDDDDDGRDTELFGAGDPPVFDSEESEVRADGSALIESGDEVTFNGRTWTVARANTRYAEIHSTSTAPRVVPVKDVEPVNGSEDQW